MEYTVIDIETMPDETMIDKLPEPDVKYGNAKDEEKRRVIYENAVAKQVDSMALNPLFGRIACIGIGDTVHMAENEKTLIEIVSKELFSKMQPICTWNGIGFDIPFIYKRAIILGIKIDPPMSFWMKRYTITPHCDLMQVWMNWYGYEKLDTVAKALLGRGKVDFDVTQIKELIKTAEGIEKISNYCKGDLEATKLLFDKMNGILF